MSAEPRCTPDDACARCWEDQEYTPGEVRWEDGPVLCASCAQELEDQAVDYAERKAEGP